MFKWNNLPREYGRCAAIALGHSSDCYMSLRARIYVICPLSSKAQLGTYPLFKSVSKVFRDSSAIIAMEFRLDGRDSILVKDEIFFCFP
jgi:hypothetical protein